MMENFTIICPPPNVTGELHLGHALIVAIQNFFVYSYRILGYKSYILPGFDHGGIGTQVMAMKKFGLEKKDPELFEKIREFANESKNAISNQMKILDLQADYRFEKYTFDSDHTEFVQDSFIKLYEMGLISKKKAIVNFDTILGTSISDLEVNYEERSTSLFFLQYELVGYNNQYIEVATTRPETIFADCALMVHPEDKRYLNFHAAKIPIIEKVIPILRDEYVDMNFGTGVLKVTPAHDINDWKLGKKYNLEPVNIINENGLITEDHFCNMTIIQARKKIIEELQCKSETIIQKFPINRTSGADVEYLLQEQWFLDMEKAAQLALVNFPKIEPTKWKENYIAWLKNIEPWCLSRNIIWGHKIPVWYNNSEYKVSKNSPGENWIQSTETIDTWFSSALWPLSYKKSFGIYPTDLLITAYDILFFWVARMIMLSLILDNSLPFKQVYINELIRDSKGRKMSKTKGNVLNPVEIIKKYNLDTLNFSFLSMISPNTKIKFSEDSLHESRKVITKIKSLYNYSQIRNNKGKKHEESCLIVDIYFQSRIVQLERSFRENLQNLQIHLIRQQVIDLLYEICDWLVEVDKIFHTCFSDIFQYFKKFLFPFFPDLMKEIGVEYIWSKYESQENDAFQSFKSVVTKVRHFKKSGIEVKIKNSKISPLICKLCNIEEHKNANFPYYEEMLFLNNLSPLQSELQILQKKFQKSERFFQSDIEKIDANLVFQKQQERQEILDEIKNLEAIINE